MQNFIDVAVKTELGTYSSDDCHGGGRGAYGGTVCRGKISKRNHE